MKGLLVRVGIDSIDGCWNAPMRVEELLRWCDTLAAQLQQTRTLGAHLLASTLHHLLAA